MEPVIFSLTLSQQAKSSGGDKYLMTGSSSIAPKERFIYVPQNISRSNGKASAELTLSVSKTQGAIEFSLLKSGKTGDDRYKAVDEKMWAGDIYLSQELRNQQVFLTLTLNS